MVWQISQQSEKYTSTIIDTLRKRRREYHFQRVVETYALFPPPHKQRMNLYVADVCVTRSRVSVIFADVKAIDLDSLFVLVFSRLFVPEKVMFSGSPRRLWGIYRLKRPLSISLCLVPKREHHSLVVSRLYHPRRTK